MSSGIKKIIEKAKNQDKPVVASMKLLVRFKSAYLRIRNTVMTRITIASVDGIHT